VLKIFPIVSRGELEGITQRDWRTTTRKKDVRFAENGKEWPIFIIVCKGVKANKNRRGTTKVNRRRVKKEQQTTLQIGGGCKIQGIGGKSEGGSFKEKAG